MNKAQLTKQRVLKENNSRQRLPVALRQNMHTLYDFIGNFRGAKLKF